MDEYVKREDLILAFCGADTDVVMSDPSCNFYMSGFSWSKTDEVIKGIPAADVAPVVHGKWEFVREMASSGEFRCSCCKMEKIFSRVTVRGVQEYSYDPFCRNCGAKMDMK